MKKHIFALLALVLFVAGCPSNAPQVDASDFAPAVSIDASVEAGHRVGSFNPTCTGNGVPLVASGVQNAACQTVLGVANGGTNRSALGTTLQVLRTNAAATDTEWATISGASPAGSTGELQINNAGSFGAATNVKGGSGFLSIGATPSASGDIRLQNISAIKFIRLGSDFNALAISAGTSITLGDATGVEDVYVVSGNSGTIRLKDRLGNFLLSAVTAALTTGAPILGESAQSSPWSVHGKTTVATTGTFTLAAADYAKDAIMLSGGTAGTVTFPTPADDAHAYYKTVINTSGVTKTLTDGGASTPTLATALTGRYLFDLAGVHLTGPSVAYP